MINIAEAVEVIEVLGGQVYIDEEGDLTVSTTRPVGECPYCWAKQYVLYHTPEEIAEFLEEYEEE